QYSTEIRANVSIYSVDYNYTELTIDRSTTNGKSIGESLSSSSDDNIPVPVKSILTSFIVLIIYRRRK
ncbi:MAG: hypothetical protein ACXAB7_23930, partial [Candidatus Kariarchaeaceae archaeon]